MDPLSLLIGYILASSSSSSDKGGGGGGGGGGASPPNPWPNVPPGGNWGPPSPPGGAPPHIKPTAPPGGAPPGGTPPGVVPQAPERVYMIANGDQAWKVAQRFSGQVKRGLSWVWKDLRFSADGPIDTTGSIPKPWRAGLTIYLPDSWTVDLGKTSGAAGDVSTAPRIHGDELVGMAGCEGIEHGDIEGETTDGIDTV